MVSRIILDFKFFTELLFCLWFLGKRSEVIHAQYAAQVRQSRTDPVATAHSMLSAFCLDQLLTSESGLTLYLAIWSRLRTDCSDILHWIKSPGQFVSAVSPRYLNLIVETVLRMYRLSFHRTWMVVLHSILRWPLLLMYMLRVSTPLSTLMTARNAVDMLVRNVSWFALFTYTYLTSNISI